MAHGKIIGYDPDFQSDKPIACKCGWQGKMAECGRYVFDGLQNFAVYYCPECSFAVNRGEWELELSQSGAELVDAPIPPDKGEDRC